MKIIDNNFWGEPEQCEHTESTAWIIPVCGSVDSKNSLLLKDRVGVAIARKYPDFGGEFGKLISLYGNKPYLLRMGNPPRNLITLPTRRFWNEPHWDAILKISLRAVVTLADSYGLDNLRIPQWTEDAVWMTIERILGEHLDDRFTLVLRPSF